MAPVAVRLPVTTERTRGAATGGCTHIGGRTLSAMTDPAKRERAALDVLELLLYRWALGPTFH